MIEIVVSFLQVPIWFFDGFLLLLIVFIWRHVYLLSLKLISVFFCTRLNFLFFGVIKKVDNNILECVQLHPNKRLLLFSLFFFFFNMNNNNKKDLAIKQF